MWDGIVPKLQTALASADSTPDIIELGNTQAPTFCAVGALTDLTDMKADLGGDNLTPSLVTLGSFDDKMYAAPFYAGSRIFIYRKDYFKDAGISIPTTVPELTDAAIKLTKANPGKSSNFSGLWLPGIGAQQCFAWLFTYGGRIAALQGDQWVADMSSDNSQAAFKQLSEIWKNGSKAGSVTDSTQGGNLHVPFNAGQAGMIFGFNWKYKSIKASLRDSGKVGFFGFPPVTAGDKGHPFAGGSNIAISAKSKNQDAAKDALKLIFSKTFQELFATQGGWVPGNLQYASALGTNDLAKLTTEAVANSVGTPAAKNWALVESAKTVDDFFVQLAAGGDAVSLAKTADSAINSKLNS